MTKAIDDNQKDVIKKAVQDFVDAQLEGREPDIDEFVKQYPGVEHQIKQSIKDMRRINTLFDSLVQADESDFESAAAGQNLVGKKIGSFEITEVIGSGGMGIVYQARDTRLDRLVAIKSIPVKQKENSSARMRLKREAKLLASLNHPNIAVIYDIIEADDGDEFLVLEYVPGKTLAELIAGKPLKVKKALSVARQVAEAVSAAHRAGIIHRDLKPANIKITPDGNVKVLDFGLAKVPQETGNSGQITATEPGRIIGTPAYMSPEQARGKDIDYRTDIWSFGCILYEMLTGKFPFEGQTATDTLARIIERQPDWQLLPETTPVNIRVMLRRCLEKDPDRRLGNIVDAAVEINDTLSKSAPVQIAATKSTKLRKVVMISCAVVVGITLFIFALKFIPQKQIQPSPKEIRLVVLPFDNLGPADDEWFVDGMTDEITGRLATIHGLAVISRQSAIQYKNREKSTPQIALELEVDYILEGTIQREQPSDPNSRIRIRCQLIRTIDDTHVWTQNYDNNMKEIFSLQSDVAEQVAQGLDITLLENQRKALASIPTENTEAYTFYMKGMDYFRLSGPENRYEIAIEMFEKAIELDPNMVLAYVQLSNINTYMYWLSKHKDKEHLAVAEKEIKRALELDPDLPAAHIVMARYYYQCHFDYDNALKHLDFVRKRHPNNVGVLRWTGVIQERQGKFQQAVDNLEKAFELDPLSSSIMTSLGRIYSFMSKYQQSEHYYKKAMLTAPDLAWSYGNITWVYLSGSGDTGKARAVLEDGLKKVPTTSNNPIINHLVLIDIFEHKYQEALEKVNLKLKDFDTLDWFIPNDLRRAEIYGYMGKEQLKKKYYQAAVSMLEKKVEEDPNDSRFHSTLGMAYAGLGRNDDAIKHGKLALDKLPVSKDVPRETFRREDLARIYTMAGEYDAAIEQIKLLLDRPSEFSLSLLQLDPAWKPLYNHPVFIELVGSVKPQDEIQTFPKEIRLVVLPFDNLGPADDEWFVDGMTDELTSRLAVIHGLAVISRQSAIQYKNKQTSTSQIAKDLRVDYILEGTIQREKPSDPNSRIRIRCQLIRTIDDTHLWAQNYDRNMNEIFRLQSQVAEQVAQHLDIMLLEQDRTWSDYIPTSSTEAYNLLLQGKAANAEGTYHDAIPFYEKAIELDPNYVKALGELAWAHMSIYWLEDPSSEHLVKAEVAARRAFALLPDHPFVRLVMARYYYQGHLDYDSALEHLEKARELHPNHTWMLYWTHTVLCRQGDFDQALVNIRRAFELAPLSAHFAWSLGITLRYLREYQEAEHYFELAIMRDPNRPSYYNQKAELYLLWQGNLPKARAVMEEGLKKIDTTKHPNPKLFNWWMNTIDIWDGRYEDALDRLSQEQEISEMSIWHAYNAFQYAEIYGYLNKPDLAKQYYESARNFLENKVAEHPDIAEYYSLLGLAYAGLGDKEKAVEHGKRGTDISPVTKDALDGQDRVEQLARIYVMVGKYELAIEQLEYLLSIPSRTSGQTLRLNPVWDPLREYPRFKKLIESGNREKLN